MTEINIGNQVWMGKNLDVDIFRNGDTIFHAKNDAEWEKAGKNRMPAWCYYNNDPLNGEIYGRLYNWFALDDPRGLAPMGWRIPSGKDWHKLVDNLGGKKNASIKMKSITGWINGGNGTDESTFGGLPGGRRCSYGEFESTGLMAFWWTSSQDFLPGIAWYRFICFNDSIVYGSYGKKERGMSIRCIKE